MSENRSVCSKHRHPALNPECRLCNPPLPSEDLLDALISLFSQVVDDLSYGNMLEKRLEALSIINEHLENHR